MADGGYNLSTMSADTTLLSPRELQSLRSIIVRLRGTRAKIDAKIAEIERVIAEDAQAALDLGPSAKALKPGEKPPLPHRIREILQERPDGMTPRELAEVLTREGYRPTTNRSLSRQVGSQLHRMAGRGTGGVRRENDGNYRIVPLLALKVGKEA